MWSALGNDVKCTCCGKDVYAYGRDYVYKKQYKGKIKYFCGWNCMRKFMREHDMIKENKFDEDK